VNKLHFTLHLLEAAYLNFCRSFYYVQKSYGVTLFLSYLLILLELSLLHFALFFDIWALKYNAQGIPIVRNDFVSMKRVREKNRQPEYKNKVSPSKVIEVLQINKKEDFVSLYDELLRVIAEVKKVEKKYQAHFAMTLHILESAALCAKHAIVYEKQNPQTRLLAMWLIKFQLLALTSSAYFDYLAQQFHQKNIGIIVNDLPQIDL
jgi:hypothetical protein